MAFDSERYRKEVLDPARARGNQPPADLLARYALADHPPSDLGPHIGQVVNYWRTLTRSNVYKKLAQSLLVAHEELEREGFLKSRERLEGRSRGERSAAQERLSQRAQVLAGASSCVSPVTLSRLVEDSAGLLDELAVRATLQRQGLRVVEPLMLPSAAPPKYAALQQHLAIAGVRLSPEVVFENLPRDGFSLLRGFRLRSSGQRLDAAQIAGARQRLEQAAHNDRKTARSNVLTILADAAKLDRLDALLLWEVVQVLRQAPGAFASQRALAAEARALGLDAGEAELLGLSVFEAGLGVHRVAVAEVQQHLVSGSLREAQRLAISIGDSGEAAELRGRLEAADLQVAGLVARAGRAQMSGREEEAAGLLAEALQLAGDDESIQQRFRAIPPPPPTEVRTTVDRARVTVGWRPSRARAGPIRYRLVRRHGRGPTAVVNGASVGETEGNQLLDLEPPAGEPLFYGVFASRDGLAWSAGASAGPCVVTPEVDDLRLLASDSSVIASWRPHPRTVDVLAFRAEEQPPVGQGDGQRVRSVTLNGFNDDELQVDRTYHYRVSAVYQGPRGDRYASPGVVGSVTLELPPPPVADFEVAVVPLAGGAQLRATWTPPERGSARIRVGEIGPSWSPGALLPASEPFQSGRELTGRAEFLPDGRLQLTLPAGELQGRFFFTPVTLGRSVAAVGRTVELAIADPIWDLCAQRFDDLLRLRWEWPEQSALARVWWQSRDAEPAATIECQRRAYMHEGGLELRVGPGAVTVSVQAVIRRGDREVWAVPVQLPVEGRAASVRYRLQRARWPRREAMLVVEAESACELPPLVLVRRAGSVLPLRPDQGVVVAEVPAQRLEPGLPLSIPVPLQGAGPARLRLFLTTPAAEITLLDPPSQHLRI
jgi:hypothetical protein